MRSNQPSSIHFSEKRRTYLAISPRWGCILGLMMWLSLGWVNAQPRDTLDLLLRQAKKHVIAAQYADALKIYTRILAQNEVIEGQATFFIGKALYQVHQLRASDRFLRFYKQRVRTEDPYQKAADTLLSRIRYELAAIDQCNYCNEKGYRLIRSTQDTSHSHLLLSCADCSGKGRRLCNLCYGQGLLIEINTFGQKTYTPCPRCQSQASILCTNCQGRGYLKNKILSETPSTPAPQRRCNHKPSH